MILVYLIAILFFGGALAWLAGRGGSHLPRWIALGALTIDTLLLLALAPQFLGTDQVWPLQFTAPWIPRFGVQFHFAADGLSYVLLLLTCFLGLVAVAAAWEEIQKRSGFFYFNLLWVLAGVLGIFTALDLFLFFFFWEVMLIPMYFVIAIWGHENRTYAAIKFFLFTQISGLLMLAAIVALAVMHYQSSGQLTFDYLQLLETPRSSQWAWWLMLGFFIAFAVKLPSVPFHTWLPDAHTQAPTAGSVILAGILLKTGAYGLLRFIFPLFPEAARDFAPTAMALGMISVLYGAAMAFDQTDIKRLVAYSSISHMGFITLGLFAASLDINVSDSVHQGGAGLLAQQGAVMTMVAHGLSSAALFALAGALQYRLHTREFSRLGGFWRAAPRFGGYTLFFCLAALGLPGLANFIGEFLVLLGSFSVSPTLTVLAALGMIASPVYALMVVQKAFHGEPVSPAPRDLNAREMAMITVLALPTVYFGFSPQPVFTLVEPALQQLSELSAVITLSTINGVP